MVAPGVGTAIGAGVGFIAGGLLGNMQANSQRVAQRNAMEQAEQARIRSIMQEFGRRQQAEQTQLAATQRPRSASGASGGNVVNSTTGFIGGTMPSQSASNSSGSSGTF
jgi:hypothetical protein